MEVLKIKNVIFFDEVQSTMNEMEQMVMNASVDDFTAVLTSFQRSGQGQEGNSWESEKGRNLLITYYLQPYFVKPSEQFLISKIASLALYETILHFLPGSDLKIKWPNDLYIGDNKVAGILIRHQLKGEHIQHSLLGIGLNVNQDAFSPELPNPVSLKLEGKQEFDLKTVHSILHSILKLFYSYLKDGVYQEIDELYHQRLYQLGMPAQYTIRGREAKARILGVDEYGRLLLEEKERIHVCDLKEVVYRA